MSQRYEFGRAGGKLTRAPMRYIAPGTDTEAEEVYFDAELEPGNGALVIGNAYDSAYALEGTPAELRTYVRDLAALLGMSIAPCARCGANLADGSGDGVDGHWAGCPVAEDRCGECGEHIADPHAPECKTGAAAALGTLADEYTACGEPLPGTPEG